MVTDTTTLITQASTKQAVEDYLNDYFDVRLNEAKQLDPSFARLWNSIYKLFQSGGKRIRPYTALLTYQAYGGRDTATVVPAAAAQELLHLAMLMHDDIIDRDTTRYGVSNVTGQYLDTYEQHSNHDVDTRHYSDSAALLGGDLLLSDAYRLIARCAVEPSLILDAQAVLNDAIYTVIGGELLDTESAIVDHTNIRPLDIARNKTASYSFVGPLVMGAMLAGASTDEQNALKRLGESMGVAYQLRDDLLGMFGVSEVTGKSTTSDLSEGKYTYLVELFYELADDAQIEEFQALFGRNELSYEEVERARDLLIRTSAKQKVEDMIDELYIKAETQIDELAATDEAKVALHTLLTACVKRNK